MKISLNEIKKLVKIPEGISDEELIRLIGARLVEVEGTEDWSEKYKGIKIVKVISCEPIPETHLHLCQIDCGKKVQVVCGAPNVHEGMFAAWIAPGCIVPETFGTAEPFEISSRKLRGYESSGMLAAADELALGEDHAGIIEIDPEMPGVKPGASFAEVFDLNDIILDIENKSLTHRPDCFGLIGFAREVAGILGVKFEEQSEKGFSDNKEISPRKTTNIRGPESETVAKRNFSEGPTECCSFKGRDNLPSEKSFSFAPKIEISNTDLCPRYTCAVIDFSEPPRNNYFTASDAFLSKAGMHTISPIVDVTNIVMLKTGQPLHAFDYDKFIKAGGKENPEIIVRAAKDKEKLELLDGKTIECDENDILITSNNVPVALAGAMGGLSTAIDENTSRIIIESATFSLYHLRKTQMKHGIFSEAITRFTKGQPASQTFSALKDAIELLGADPLEIADEYPNPMETPPIEVSVEEINSLLGTDYKKDLIIKTLENVGLACDFDKTLQVYVPAWRTDLHIKEDIIEEVGRLLGFDNIPLDFPKRPFIGAKIDPMLELKNRIRNILSDRLNAHEVLTYSFVSKALQEKFGEDPKDSYEIVNSISPELECFRQSLVPSLLEKVQENQKAGYKDFALYEMNQISKKSFGLNHEEVPVMKTNLALVVTGDYYQAKAYLAELLKELGCSLNPSLNLQQLPPSLLKKFKLEAPIAYFEINLDELLETLPTSETKNLRFSRFPAVYRDVTVKISEDTPYQTVYDAIKDVLEKSGLIYEVTPVSIYEPKENLKKTKNLSFRLILNSEDKTLNSEEISAIMSEIERGIKKISGVII